MLNALILSLGLMTATETAPLAGLEDASNVLVNRGVDLVSTEDHDAARKLFERAIVANPANVAAHVALGTAWEVQGNVKKALKYYAIALEIEPTDTSALTAQALAYLAADLPERADESRAHLAKICGEGGCAALSTVADAIEAYEPE